MESYYVNNVPITEGWKGKLELEKNLPDLFSAEGRVTVVSVILLVLCFWLHKTYMRSHTFCVFFDQSLVGSD